MTTRIVEVDCDHEAQIAHVTIKRLGRGDSFRARRYTLHGDEPSAARLGKVLADLDDYCRGIVGKAVGRGPTGRGKGVLTYDIPGVPQSLVMRWIEKECAL